MSGTLLASNRSTIRLAVLIDHPVQYFAPLFRELARRQGIKLTVLYCNRIGLDAAHDPQFGRVVQWDVPLLDGSESVFLSRRIVQGGFQPRLLIELLPRRFDVLLVHGYASATNLVAIGLSRLYGCPVLMRGDTRLEARHELRSWRSRLKRRLFRHIQGFVAVGTLNRNYYLAFGVEARKVFFSPFSVDNAFFRLEDEERVRARSRIRLDLGIGPGTVLGLFVAKLTPNKRPEDVVIAVRKARGRGLDIELAIIGTGVLEGPIQERVAAAGDIGIHLLGFRNQSELPAVLAAADLLVLPSAGEAWGLVVNEAMAAGLPVVVSDEVGAGEDLVRERGTGIVYACGDVDALTDALIELGTSPDTRRAMGARAAETIRGWGLQATATGIVEATKAVLARPDAVPLQFPCGVAASPSSAIPVAAWRSRLRVLILVRYYLPGDKSGGPVRSLANLVQRLGDEFEFRILTLDRDAFDNEPFPGVTPGGWCAVGKAMVSRLAPGVRAPWRIASAIRATPHDLLYVNSFFDPIFSLFPLLMRLFGCFSTPLLIAPRGELSRGALAVKPRKKSAYIKVVRQIGLFRGASWHGASELESKDIARVMGAVPTQTAMNLPEPPGHPLALPPRAGPLKIAFLSRIAPKKNLLYALEILSDCGVSVDFTVFGPADDEGYWGRCRKRADALQSNVRFHYAGHVPHDLVTVVLAQNDLFLLPTLGENYGHVILEAMMAGLPVLVSDCTPWRGLVEKGVGWDLPLAERGRWIDAVREAASLDCVEYASWRNRIRAYAETRSMDSVPLEDNRRLLLRAAGWLGAGSGESA